MVFSLCFCFVLLCSMNATLLCVCARMHIYECVCVIMCGLWTCMCIYECSWVFMWSPKRVVAKATLTISSTTPFLVALKHSLTEIEAHNFGEAFTPVTGFTGTGKHVTVFTWIQTWVFMRLLTIPAPPILVVFPKLN